MNRILVIEDEPAMRHALEDALTSTGYRVITAADGAIGLERAQSEHPDLILLDVMLPKLDGFALAAELRRLRSTVPILLLTAKGGVEDRVTGLDAGADDYLAKPFHPQELLARVRALLRRQERGAAPVDHLRLGDVVIDFARQTASRGSQPLHLTPKEISMLRLLAEARGAVITREQFLDLVWGYGAFPTTRTVDTHIAALRTKLEAVPAQPKYLVTVHGSGYRLVLPT
ncbi:MAG: response regulator transcription factor [Verrucomicrobiales bacterium]|nr:response regulator transcription factor [Verrucomicrobiales bacterium]